MSKVTLKEKVANYKLLARESLRMDLINPRLSKVANLEADVKSVTDCKTELEHDVIVENYEIGKLDTEHPNYDKTKATKEEEVKSLTIEIAAHVKSLEDLAKEIADQKDAIAKIESGETKVSLEALNDLVTKMIEQDALNSVATVE